jgi:photosystem II stability/assembly factor-like uncharacterized protein
MKKILFLLLVALLSACAAPASAPAETIPEITSLPLEQPTPDIPMINAPTVEAPQLAVLHMLTEFDGWGLTDSAILRTNDGGDLWYNVSLPGSASLSYGVSGAFLDAQRAMIITPDVADPMRAGTLYRTSDGGLTWNLNSIPFGSAQLRFLDETHGWAMVDLGVGAGSNAIAIFQTTDGGIHWDQTFINDPIATDASEDIPLGGLKGVFFARDMQTAWVGGIVYSMGAFYLYRTDDGGRSWGQVSADLPPSALNAQVNINAIQFPTATDGFLCLSFSGETDLTRAVYVTRDAGDTWSLTPTLIPGGRSVDFVSAAEGFLFDGSQFYATRDAGATWTIVKPDVVFDESFMSMDFVNTSTGWLIASDPTTFEISLYKTMDGGATWNPQ